MKEFHLSDGDKIATLSFGAKTKLSLLLALSRRPKVLILDEPTTGLDAVSKQQVFSELLKAVEDGERTVLISSHGLSDIERFADHVGMIKNGKLLLEGRTDEIVDRFRLAEFFSENGTNFQNREGLIILRRKRKPLARAARPKKRHPKLAANSRRKRNLTDARDAGGFIRRASQRRGGSMKLIILDYFRRWWLALAAIFIGYIIFQVISIQDTNSQTASEGVGATVNHTVAFVHNIYVFQVVMWLGFLSMFDLQRGGVRTLAILPLTAKQIGRALWLASVLLPALALLVIGFLTFSIFPPATNRTISLEGCLINWIISAFYLGAIFGARILMTTKMPATFIDRIRTMLPNLLFAFALFGLLFMQMQTLTKTKTTLIFTVYLILSVAGWFRAERIVLQRAGIRFAAQSSSKKIAQYKVPQGYGGLPYLAHRIFFKITLIGLAIISWMALCMPLFHFSHDQNHVQSIVSMIDTWPRFLMFLSSCFLSVPLSSNCVFCGRCRFLRRLLLLHWFFCLSFPLPPLV